MDASAQDKKDRGGKTVLTICAILLMIYLASVGILFSIFHAKFETLKSELEAESADSTFQYRQRLPNVYNQEPWFMQQDKGRETEPELEEKGILHYANSDKPGDSIDLPSLIKERKTNIILFFSHNDAACQEIIPVMEKLAAKRTDFHICLVDIDRRGSSSADYASPVSQQFDIHSVPKYRLYDRRGKFMSTDDDAKLKVRAFIRQSYLD